MNSFRSCVVFLCFFGGVCQGGDNQPPPSTPVRRSVRRCLFPRRQSPAPFMTPSPISGRDRLKQQKAIDRNLEALRKMTPSDSSDAEDLTALLTAYEPGMALGHDPDNVIGRLYSYVGIMDEPMTTPLPAARRMALPVSLAGAPPRSPLTSLSAYMGPAALLVGCVVGGVLEWRRGEKKSYLRRAVKWVRDKFKSAA